MTVDVGALAARAEIHDALMRYCRGIDRCDADLVRSAYHPDSYDDHGHWKGNGWDFAEFIAADIRTRTSRTTHAVANVLIELAGDRAWVESYVFAYLWGAEPDTDVLDVFAGRYVDRFERRDGAWLIADRQVVHDWDARPTLGSGRLGLPLDAFRTGQRSHADAAYDRDAAPPGRARATSRVDPHLTDDGRGLGPGVLHAGDDP